MLTRPTVSRPRPGNTRPRPGPEVFKAKAKASHFKG